MTISTSTKPTAPTRKPERREKGYSHPSDERAMRRFDEAMHKHHFGESRPNLAKVREATRG